MAASQKAMDIFDRLGDRTSWAQVAGNHCQHLMVKGSLAQATGLIAQIGDAAPGFADPNAFELVNLLCGWFWKLINAPREAMRYYRLGLKRPGHDSKRRDELLQYLANCETATGNLREAKRLAAENYVNPTFQFRIAYYEGDWKAAANALEKALNSRRSIGAVWDELIALSHAVDLWRVTGDYPGAVAALERALSLCESDDLYWDARLHSEAVVLYFDAARPEIAADHVRYCRKVVAAGEDGLGRAGSLWRAEAIVAALRERFHDSDHYFEKSIEICRRYSLPWEEAETPHYWGRALLQAGQSQRALEKLDAAIKLYRDHSGGQVWVDRVEADRRRAEPPLAQARPQSVGAIADTAREAVLRDEGDFWTISYQGRNFRVRDVRGLRYIACLLRHTNERFHVRELAASVVGVVPPLTTSGPDFRADWEDATPILDSKSKAEYRARPSELRADLEEAERMNDRGRAERIRREVEVR
jgi:tetratricopeptide (TPR) repeat protein